MEILGSDVELVHEVDPKARAAREELADRIVHLTLGSVDPRIGGRRAGEPDVLAEVQRHLAAAAAQRARAQPDDLAAGAQLVEPRGAVGAEASRQDVALPDLRGEGDPLQRDERLSQPIRSGAGGPVGVYVLPVGKKAGELPLLHRLRLGPQMGQAGAAQAAQDVGIAPLALGAPGQQLSANEVSGALELPQGGRGIDAVAARGLLGREGTVGARVAAHERDERIIRRVQQGLRQAGRRWHTERVAVDRRVLRRDPALLAADPHARRAPLALELVEHRGRRVALDHSLLAFLRREVAEPSQDLLKRVAILRPRGLDTVLEGIDHLDEGVRVDQLAQLLLSQQLPQELAVQRERGRPPLGIGRVALVHVSGDVVEEERGGKG